jgi:hypothetical protein
LIALIINVHTLGRMYRTLAPDCSEARTLDGCRVRLDID